MFHLLFDHKMTEFGSIRTTTSLAKQRMMKEVESMAQDRTSKQNIDPMEPVDVGAHIVALRDSLGWSQADLARWLDIDAANLSKIEHNQRRISAEKLLQIQTLVHREQEKRLHSGDFAMEQGRQLYEHIVPNLVREMNHLGMSQAKMDGIRESISGAIKSAFSD